VILNCKKWKLFENNLKKREKVNISNNFKIINALYKEAIELKILPMKNPLEGLDIKIKIAKVVNNVSTIA
jgi:hypothetical protein